MTDNKLICPVCGKEVVNLLAHVKVHDKFVLSKEDFYDKFPDYKGKLIVDVRKPGECKCPLCEKVYAYNNSLQLHIKNIHPDYYKDHSKETGPRKETKCKNITCPICGEIVHDLKQHIKCHKMTWEEFCKTYNWDPNVSKIVTQEYRDKLSKNKTEFYKSERGIIQKKQQSIELSKNNPSQNRKIIEKAIYTRSVNGNIPQINGRGITIQYDGKTFRSYNECSFYIVCKQNNIDLQFEPHEYIVRYFNKEKNFTTTYLPDFYIEGIGVIELKESKYTKEHSKDIYKYIEVSKVYKEKNIKFDIYYPNELYELLGISILPFEVKDLVKEKLLEAKDDIKIYCKENSLLMKEVFGENLKDLNFIKLI